MDAEDRFGRELRRRRHDAGLSLSDLATRVHYSKGHLSKVESGEKAPSEQLARQCDAALRAGTALLRLVVPASGQTLSGDTAQTLSGDTALASAGQPAESWTLTFTGDAGRLAVAPDADPGAVEVSRWAMPVADRAGRLPDGTVEIFGDMLGELRRLGQRQAPAVVLPGVLAQASTLRSLAGRVTEQERPAVLIMAARFAEYAGWCLQEAGDEHGALSWTSRAAQLAVSGGDVEFAAYADVRRALVTLYRHDANQTIALARRGGAAVADHRIRGLAAQREAQGHALAGDDAACNHALDRAAEHLALAAAPHGIPVIGTSTLRDPAAMVRGWCLHDLGQPAEAAETLERELRNVPPSALRTRVRFGVRLGLAYAESAELDQVSATLGPLLGPAIHVDSSTVRADLARLSQVLRRWHREPVVRELMPGLNTVLHASSIA